MEDINEKVWKCIIIGGGASGLYCAALMSKFKKPKSPKEILGESSSLTSDTNDSSGVLMLEKTRKSGTKLLMSGGGRCNITHDGSIKDFIEHYGNSGTKIRKLLYSHSNQELRYFLEGLGIETGAESDGRVFPVNRKASEVRDALLVSSVENGVEIITGSEVIGIERIDGKVHGVDEFKNDDPADAETIDIEGTSDTAADMCDGAEAGYMWLVRCTDKCYQTTKVVVATGGCSYPETGSDGSMFEILKRSLGVRVTELRPALSPISIRDYKYADLAGISLDAEITMGLNSKSELSDDYAIAKTELTEVNAVAESELRDGHDAKKTELLKKRNMTKCGSILFTHDGFSGPAVLNISKYVDAGSKISFNYIHPITYDEARALLTEKMKGSKVSMSRAIAESFGIPSRLADAIAKQAWASTNEAARILTHDEMEVLNAGTFANAMSTAGGVALSEIDLHTMELIKHKGIYVIGEALDICGDTGGYNLQFAYSTAASAADDVSERTFE